MWIMWKTIRDAVEKEEGWNNQINTITVVFNDNSSITIK